MEHRLILGGEAYLPFARSCVAKLKKLGLPYADQSYEVDGVSIKVRIQPGHEYIRIEGGFNLWVLVSYGSSSYTGRGSDEEGYEAHTNEHSRCKLFRVATKNKPKTGKIAYSGAEVYDLLYTTAPQASGPGGSTYIPRVDTVESTGATSNLGRIRSFSPYKNAVALVTTDGERTQSVITTPVYGDPENDYVTTGSGSIRITTRVSTGGRVKTYQIDDDVGERIVQAVLPPRNGPFAKLWLVDPTGAIPRYVKFPFKDEPETPWDFAAEAAGETTENYDPPDGYARVVDGVIIPVSKTEYLRLDTVGPLRGAIWRVEAREVHLIGEPEPEPLKIIDMRELPSIAGDAELMEAFNRDYIAPGTLTESFSTSVLNYGVSGTALFHTDIAHPVDTMTNTISVTYAIS